MATPYQLLLAILATALTQLTAQPMVPCSGQPGQQDTNTDHPLPVLQDQFQVHVEANIVQKGYTRNVVEYYDYTNNRVMIESHDHNTSEIIKTVLDYTTQEARVIYENGTCQFMVTNSSSNHYGYMLAANSSHIKTTKDLLYFSKEMGEMFVGGDELVRGIPVDHWRACVHLPMANGTFYLDYYFTKAGPGQDQVPVRATINGTAHENKTGGAEVYSFYHIYEFTDFHPGPIADQSVFEIPIGTFCHSNSNRKATPKLPQYFSMGLETMLQPPDGSRPHVLNERMYYDGLSQVMRVDIDGPTMMRDVHIYGGRPLTVIHDETNGMRYVIDKWEGNCTVDTYRSSMEMFTPEDGLAVLDKSFLYQGKKTLRGLSVESWAYLNTTDNTITEVLFQQRSLPDERPPQLDSGPRGGSRSKRVPAPGRGANAPYVPVGIYNRRVAKGYQEDNSVLFNLYGFLPYHPDPDVFDVSQCYKFNHGYAYMSLKIKGTYEKAVQHNRRNFVTSLRSAIARGAGISVMRVTSISVEADTQSPDQLLVYCRLLDNSLSSENGNNLPSLAAAKLNLASSVAAGLNFDVQYANIEQNFEVTPDTLWEIKSMYKDSTLKTYSSASMAGLGIGMVVIGALLGLAVAYLIYKRIDTSIPYEITH